MITVACSTPDLPDAPVRDVPADDAVDGPLDDALSLTEVTPSVVDPLGGSHLRVQGNGFTDAVRVSLGGVVVSDVDVIDGHTLTLISPPVPSPESGTVTVTRDALEASLPITFFSPAELPSAHLFDAAFGLEAEDPARTYAWQRLSADLGIDWLPRDGNTLDWLPSAGRLFMVAGWNPYAPPDGFDDVDPALGLVPRPTTDEVWSSVDGVSWTLALPRDHGTFERRHAHNALLFHDRLWMIGGDWWQHAYNHDVVSSSDGVHWTVEVAQTPWSDRALLVAGVHDDHLWVVGGQDLAGPRESFAYHNDVWRSADGITWEEVLPDGPESPTHFSGRGVIGELASFRGRLWLVGGGRYRDDAVGTSYFQEVWSSADGVTWTEHAPPPWDGRIWHDVRVFDDRLFVLFGSNPRGNLNEVWFTDDGETWERLPEELSIAPGSHAQGVAETPDGLVVAGGNYGFAGSSRASFDRSTWRLSALRGHRVTSWRARGSDAVLSAEGEARPLFFDEGLEGGFPGVYFDGVDDLLALASQELQPEGRTVLWVARTPWVPAPAGWDAAPVVNPLFTIVGDGDAQYCAAGMGAGSLYYTSAGPSGWLGTERGSGLQEGTGSVHVGAFTHDATGVLTAYLDGEAIGAPVDVGYTANHGWSRVGAGLGGGGARAFTGTLGAVLVLPYAADAETIARIEAWARGRFGAP